MELEAQRLIDKIAEEKRVLLVNLKDCEKHLHATIQLCDEQAAEIEVLRAELAELSSKLMASELRRGDLCTELAEAKARADRAERLVFGEFVAYYASSGSDSDDFLIEEYGENEPLLLTPSRGTTREECIKNFYAEIQQALAAMQEEK